MHCWKHHHEITPGNTVFYMQFTLQQNNYLSLAFVMCANDHSVASRQNLTWLDLQSGSQHHATNDQRAGTGCSRARAGAISSRIIWDHKVGDIAFEWAPSLRMPPHGPGSLQARKMMRMTTHQHLHLRSRRPLLHQRETANRANVLFARGSISRTSLALHPAINLGARTNIVLCHFFSSTTARSCIWGHRTIICTMLLCTDHVLKNLESKGRSNAEFEIENIWKNYSWRTSDSVRQKKYNM